MQLRMTALHYVALRGAEDLTCAPDCFMYGEDEALLLASELLEAGARPSAGDLVRHRGCSGDTAISRGLGAAQGVVAGAVAGARQSAGHLVRQRGCSRGRTLCIINAGTAPLPELVVQHLPDHHILMPCRQPLYRCSTAYT